MTAVDFHPIGAVDGTVKQWHVPVLHRSVPTLPLPEGPWKDEPSKVQWVDAATNLPCLIVRGGSGNLCGYAGVFPGHPLHGLHYGDLPDDTGLCAHGGITFAGGCAHSEDPSQGICHIPEPGTSDEVYWFGFDCAHSGDLQPGMEEYLKDLGMRNLTWMSHGVYRDIGYVAGEVTSLAAQLWAHSVA